MTAYEKCLEEMYSLRRFGIILGLDMIRNILEALGNPHEHYKTIHVAGTNGKGSIASNLASILQTAGYSVGLYTSPHLVRFNERIKIDNEEISEQEIVAAYEGVKKVYPGDREPTFFEYTTAMAFEHFKNRKVDWAVIETGMGGRLDATNVLVPEVSIISTLSLEHQIYLGNRLTQIAEEKGGIIKPGIPVVTGVRQKAALSVLNRIAKSKSAPLYRLGSDFRVRRDGEGGFSYFGMGRVWRDMKTKLLGRHQVDNAAVVLAACELLKDKDPDTLGRNLTIEVIRRGLEKNVWPGRLEKVSDTPFVLLDGAHNLAAVKNLSRFLSEQFPGRRITLVAGILDDKSYAAMLNILLPHCMRVILTCPKIERGLSPETLYPVAKKAVSDVRVIEDVAQAVKHAVETAAPEDVVCIAGSLYVVGEAREAFETRGAFKKGAVRINRKN